MARKGWHNLELWQSLRDAFGFPAFVNEKAARVVAGGVMVLAATALLTGWLWLSAVLAVGFALRVAAGPRFSPLGRFAARVVAPRLGAPKIVPGPPKRFAQTVGLVLTLAATAFLVAGQPVVTTALLGVLLRLRDAGVGGRLLCGLLGVRSADARGARARRRLPRLLGHHPPPAPDRLRLTSSPG